MGVKEDRILKKLEDEGLISNAHVFLVKNLEKREDKQIWVPVPGAVMSGFLKDHEWRYLGPDQSEAVRAKIAEIDKAQAARVGEQKSADVESFEVTLDLDDLGLEPLPEEAPAEAEPVEEAPVEVPEAPPAPKGKSKSKEDEE